MEQITNKEFQLRISDINVLKYSQNNILGLDSSNDNVEYSSNFNLKFIKETEEIEMTTSVKLKILDLDKDFCELKVSMKFNVHPFDAVVHELKKDDFRIPNEFLKQIFYIVIGTIRGILFEKLKGTVLQNKPLPLIDVNKLVYGEESK